MHYLRRKTDNDYIVVRHPLRDFTNTFVQGTKFCRGYGVVIRNSKQHQFIKKLPMFKGAQEFELSYLKRIFRTKEIDLIFGKDVYWHYLDAIGLNSDLTSKVPVKEELAELVAEKSVKIAEVTETVKESVEDKVAELVAEDEKINEEEISINDLTPEEIAATFKTLGKCSYIKKDGEVCGNNSLKSSPSGFCFGHLRLDPLRKKSK